MSRSGNRWESNTHTHTHTHTRYNLIKKRTIGIIHFECNYYARDG